MGKIACTAKILTIARSELITVIFPKKKKKWNSLLFNTEALLTGADGMANSFDPNHLIRLSDLSLQYLLRPSRPNT